jgi:hypothetical protein
MRSENILAIRRIPESVALNPKDILWVERNEISVSTSDAINSRLLNGVTGGIGFGSFLRRPATFLAPGTGVPQI